MKNYTYVTLVSSDDYALGAYGLAYSLKKFCKYPLLVLVSSDCHINTQNFLYRHGMNVRIIPASYFFTKINQYASTRQKLFCLSLIEYDKVCFIDSDALVYKNLDYLFDQEDYMFDNHLAYEGIDKVCGGIFVVKPNHILYNKVMNSVLDTDSEDEVVLHRWFKDYVVDFPLQLEVLHKAGLPKYWNYKEYNLSDFEEQIDFYIENKLIS